MTLTSKNWPVEVAGDRATLVAVQAPAVRADWLPEAAQAVAGRGEPCPLQGRLDQGDQAFWIYPDLDGQRAVGALSGRLAEVDGALALIWTWLAIAAEWRHFGYGGASVPVFEQAAQSLGATSALAPLPADNGVALYFWLRLGYVPHRRLAVAPSDRPSGVAPDALWMSRSLSGAGRE